MNLHSACRFLFSGATLLAATAMAAPSPCLPSRQPADEKQQPQQHARWRNPCHLVDAQKPDNQQQNDGQDKSKDVRQQLDDIEMFTRLNALPEGEQQLPWMLSDEREHRDPLQWSTQGGPGSWSRSANPMYQPDVTRARLHTDGIAAEGGIPAVPEPANVAMLLAGLAVLAGMAARKRRQR